MAAPASAETSPPCATPALPPKKPRLNPARRKAAAKVKEEVQTGQSDVLRANAKDASTTPVTRKAVETAPAVPKQLTRTKTTPAAPQSKPIADPVPIPSKPNLYRSQSAPQPSSKAKSLALTGPALVTGGLVGCAAGAALLLGVGMWYDFSGAESAILAARAAKLCMDNLADEVIASLKAGTYSADEALDMLRRTTLAYASTIPGGSPFVERMFREIDMVRKQRGKEVDTVVAETYGLLAKAGKKGAPPTEMQAIVLGQVTKLSSFAGKATQDVVARNPGLRPFRDGAVKSLQGPKEQKVPTVRVNMAVRQKSTVGM